MIYLITRIILSIVIIFSLICLWKFMKRKRTKYYKIKFFGVCSIVLILGILDGMLPFESIFLSFDSPEKALQYKYPNRQIFEVFIYEDFSVVMHANQRNNCIVAENFSRRNDRWKLSRQPRVRVTFYNNECFIKTKNTPGNVMSIIVKCTDLTAIANQTTPKEYLVTNSQNVEFEKVFFTDGIFEYYCHYGMIEDTETFIFINGEKIMIE